MKYQQFSFIWKYFNTDDEGEAYPPAMQVCSQTALASSKKPPCYNEYKVRQPNHYNKEESKWTIIVYHTQNGHANII